MKVFTGFFDIKYPGKMIASGHASDKSFRSEYDGDVEVNFIVFLVQNLDIYILQIDTLFVDSYLSSRLQEKFTRNDRPVKVICVSSHSHSLPGIDSGMEMLGNFYKDYRDFLEQKIFKEVHDCISTYSATPLFYSDYQISSKLTVGRRGSRSGSNFSLFKIRNTTPDFEQLGADIELTCLKNQNNNVVAIIWTFPAHPVLYPDNTKFSADFPGRVRTLLRQELGIESLPVLYFPGCSGDMRPMIESQRRTKSPLEFVIGQSFDRCDEYKYNKYCDNLKSEIYSELSNDESTDNIPLESISYQDINIPLSDIGITNKHNSNLKIELLRINSIIKYAFLNCEPSYGYLSLFGEGCTVTGYSSGVFGYLPTDKQISEGGYEVSGFMPFFESTGYFYNSIEQTIMDKVNEYITDGSEL